MRMLPEGEVKRGKKQRHLLASTIHQVLVHTDLLGAAGSYDILLLSAENLALRQHGD